MIYNWQVPNEPQRDVFVVLMAQRRPKFNPRQVSKHFLLGTSREIGDGPNVYFYGSWMFEALGDLVETRDRANLSLETSGKAVEGCFGSILALQENSPWTRRWNGRQLDWQ